MHGLLFPCIQHTLSLFVAAHFHDCSHCSLTWFFLRFQANGHILRKTLSNLLPISSISQILINDFHSTMLFSYTLPNFFFFFLF